MSDKNSMTTVGRLDSRHSGAVDGESTQSRMSMFNDDLRKSVFKRSGYQVSIPLDSFVDLLIFYVNRPFYREIQDGNKTPQDAYKEIFNNVPPFQRDNDKWTNEMQVLYVHNVIKGMASSPLMLYTVKPNTGKNHCKILDGLQRITSLLEFLVKQTLSFPLANGLSVSSEEILSDPENHWLTSTHVPVLIHDFDTEREAVEYYISINENMTHSKEDIKRARDYLATLPE